MHSFTPPRSHEQRVAALTRANEIRVYRARLKRDVKARRRHAADLIADPPAEILTMRVLELLLAMPKVGRVKGNKIIQTVSAAPSKTIGGLSGRQRAALIDALGGPR